MKISIKRSLEIPNEVSNSFSFEYLKALVTREIGRIDDLTLLMNEDLTDKEYLEKAQSIYDISFEDASDDPTVNLIYTSIPNMVVLYRDTSNERVVWQKRVYEALISDDVDTSKEYDKDSLNELINSGKVVLINLVSGSKLRYQYGFMLESNNADKIPMLSTMSVDDEEFEDMFARAVRKYTEGRLNSDREILLNNLKSKLEYLKRWGNESSTLTKERLMVEEELVEYCDLLLYGFDKVKEKKQK